MRFQQNPLWIRSALAAVFVSPAKPRSRPPRLLAWHNYSSQSFGANSILLFKAAGTVIYASKIAPCPRLRPIAHGTFPISWATSGVGFVQPSSRSPQSPQSEITLSAAETYSTQGYGSLQRGLRPKSLHGNFGNRLTKKENDHVCIRCIHEN